MLLPEAITGSNDIESYIAYFELLAYLKQRRRPRSREVNGVDDRPNHFALRLQKSALISIER